MPVPAPPPTRALTPVAHDRFSKRWDQGCSTRATKRRRRRSITTKLGVRKVRLAGLWCGAVRNHFRGPSTTNPKLVSYLAGGAASRALRPLRYEKRVARNRFIFFVIFLLLMMLGTIWVFVRHR